MKITEGGRGVVFLKEWTTHSLSRGLVIKRFTERTVWYQIQKMCARRRTFRPICNKNNTEKSSAHITEIFNTQYFKFYSNVSWNFDKNVLI